jgi:hypothetical protein
MLDFLSQVTIADVTEQPAAKGGGQKKERIPSGLTIRVFRDGSVYPSAELVKRFDLEYGPKDCVGCGHGFDVIDTNRFTDIKTPKRLLFISPVGKSAGRVDLFAIVSYNTDNSAKSSVLNQGSSTFGKEELLPLIKEVYGLELTKESTPDYIDLQLVANPATDAPWELPNGRQVTYLPKKKSRGGDKGSYDVVRREKPQFWVLYPVSLIEPQKTTTPTNGAQVIEDEDDAKAKLYIDQAVTKHAGALVAE